MAEHVIPARSYVFIFAALITLTGLTTGVAFLDLGALNTVVALAIAVCKMLLVVLFFMHVKYMPGLTKIVVVAGFFWLAILLSLTLGDYFTRGWTPFPQGW
jgi:cytochrome c oxidase subunit 4